VAGDGKSWRRPEEEDSSDLGEGELPGSAWNHQSEQPTVAMRVDTANGHETAGGREHDESGRRRRSVSMGNDEERRK
jgi:hypothetical protein